MKKQLIPKRKVKKCKEGEIIDNLQMYTAGYADPTIIIASKPTEKEWLLYIKDNNITTRSKEYSKLPANIRSLVVQEEIRRKRDKAVLPTVAAITLPTLIPAATASLVGSGALATAADAIGTVGTRIAGTNLGKAASAFMNNPYIDMGLTALGAYNIPTLYKNGVSNIKQGNYGRALGDFASIGLEGLGFLGTVKNIKNAWRPVNRMMNGILPRGVYTEPTTTTSQFKDPFGREITPTPYPGPDSELINAVDDALLNVLRDYFSEDKINLIKKTMNWGDAEISLLQDEILRAIGTKADILIKGPEDGFTIIGLHSGHVKGTGSNAEGYHTVTLNRERTPNLQTAEEAGIHEIGVHGKTLSMKPEDFGKSGYSDLIKEMFPRLAEITLKNAELASELLVPNKLGKYISLFKTSNDLEKYFETHNIPWNKWDKFNNKRKYFNYVNTADEKTARGYTGLLYEKLHGSEYKTQNIEQLEQFFTPESVEKFKKAVLGTAPVIGINAANDK